MRVAVVGLGVLGASVARCLALAGAEVVAFERAHPLAGTSGTSFAWVNAHRKDPRGYHDLNVAGMAEHAALAEHPGPGPRWFARTGHLEWADGDAATERLAAAVGELAARDYPAEWVTPERARALVPDLRLPAGTTDVARFPTEGYALPAPLLARLWGEATDHGARLRCPAEVVGLAETAAGVRVELAAGDAVDVDAAVTATGRWTGALSAAAGTPVPMADLRGSATVGFLGYTNPLPARLDRVLTAPALHVRPDGGGRLVLQAPDLDTRADPAEPPAADGALARELCARLDGVLAGTGGARLESLRVGQRAMPADGYPVAGFLSERIYALATHSGVTLGPLLGRLAARELLTGDPAQALAGYRPQRFTGG